MRRGEWPCTLSHRLSGSTLGIFGLGAIGSIVAAAGAGMGMRVLAWGQEASAARAKAAGYDFAASKRSCSNGRTCCRCMSGCVPTRAALSGRRIWRG